MIRIITSLTRLGISRILRVRKNLERGSSRSRRCFQGGGGEGDNARYRMWLGGVFPLEDPLRRFGSFSNDVVREGGALLVAVPNLRGLVTLELGERLVAGNKRCRDRDSHARDEVSIGSKKGSQAMEIKRGGLGFQNSVMVASNGRSGDLCLLWKEEVELVVQFSSPNHIDAEYRFGRISGGLQGSTDFNEVLSALEQLGGAGWKESQMHGFRQVVHEFQLVDVRFVGSDYTWMDNREDEIQDSVGGVSRKPRRFRFEEMWLLKASYEETIATMWNMLRRGTTLVQVCDKIRATRVALLEWQRSTFGNTKLEIAKKARTQWLKEGDRNMKVFHTRASNKQRKNTIKGLRGEYGVWYDSREGINDMVVSYFQMIVKMQEVLNNALQEPYSVEEIRMAVFQMHPSKSPGPDGMSPLFYQQFWHVVGLDVVEAGMMVTIISPNQSAFMPMRLISDNSLVAVEIGHFLHNKINGRDGFFALKLDLSKAYDRVEWRFLEVMMEKLGFAGEWIKIGMTCVTSLSYSFLVNGLSVLIAKEEQDGALSGIQLCGDAHSIHHLLFADDSFLLEKKMWMNERVAQRLNRWKSKLLSHAGKELLTKDKMCKPKGEGGLGFHDLYAFNMAVLAKPGWMVIHHPSSLIAQIFKARYFPISSFWEPKAPSSSSYCWESIVRAREVLVKGSRWVVRDGRQIQVWMDRWLPRPSTFKLSCSADMLVWHYGERGRFSIKSGYWVAQQWLQSTDSNASSSSNASAYAKLWKHLWKANIPPKVKNFTWRVCHNILPTKVNLTKKGVRVESECGICQGEEEEANTKTTRTGGLPSPWSAPPSQWWVKLNTDGALRDRDKLGGVGVVIRDWRG
ncbi:hypothetical protein ACFX15_018367 [Malus domestica]